MYITLMYIIAAQSNLQGETMAKLELPELEQNDEVNATRFVQDAGNAPQKTKQNWPHFAFPMTCWISLTMNQSGCTALKQR